MCHCWYFTHTCPFLHHCLDTPKDFWLYACVATCFSDDITIDEKRSSPLKLSVALHSFTHFLFAFPGTDCESHFREDWKWNPLKLRWKYAWSVWQTGQLTVLHLDPCYEIPPCLLRNETWLCFPVPVHIKTNTRKLNTWITFSREISEKCNIALSGL